MERIECPGNRIMQEDVERITDSSLSVDALKGKSVFITGATGLIGSQMAYLLACYNRKKDLGIRIVVMARSSEKAQKLFGHLIERGDITVYLGDINQEIRYTEPVDYVIHGASPTSSKYFVTNPVETIQTAIGGAGNVLKFAVERKVESMVFLSSLEVYGTPEQQEGTITEQDYGYIDPLSVRSSYSEGKRMVECLCASYAAEYGVPVKIARLSQTFGAGVSYDDGRVFAEFMRCALEQRDIVLHTEGKTVRSYCYTADAIRAILYILLKGQTGEAYNVTNMDTAVSIREMGELVAKTIGQSKIRVVVEIPEDVSSFGYNPEMVIRMDSGKLESLGWKATVGLEEMYRRMAEEFLKK